MVSAHYGSRQLMFQGKTKQAYFLSHVIARKTATLKIWGRGVQYHEKAQLCRAPQKSPS